MMSRKIMPVAIEIHEIGGVSPKFNNWWFINFLKSIWIPQSQM